MLDRHDDVIDYKVSCGADTHLTQNTLGYPVDKLVTRFEWPTISEESNYS